MSTITRPAGKLKMTAEEFGRILDAGVYEGRHVQLLDGELYEVTKNPPHNDAVTLLAEALRELLPRGGYSVREEKSVEPWEDWWPEPDIAVVRGPNRRYMGRHPVPAEVALLVEVSESSPQDWTVKLAGYAQAGFPVYWILDLHARRLEVYSNPDCGEYQTRSVVLETESVELVLDGRTFGRIAVADLLPGRADATPAE